MRALNLAKELGISCERLLDWMTRSGFSCDSPESEIDPAHETRIRRVFSPANRKERKGRGRGNEPDIEALLATTIDPACGEEGLDIPDSLEELEAIEREMMKAAPELRDEKPRPARTTTRSVLDGYGIQGKSTIKKLRKLLPGDIARLLNQQDLSEAQLAALTGAIKERAVLYCDHPYCRSAAGRRHSEDKTIPVRDSTVCSICSGSATRRALEEVSEVCSRAGIRRILIVGGMSSSHGSIRKYAPGNIEFRLVEGDLERQGKRVQADLRWCDLAVIWGSTILGHSVSGSYTRKRNAQGPFIVRVSRRSVEALCAEVVKHLEDHSGI
ncbi:MAG: hypothetical protein K8R46_06005 [Pirellulales bacterium]|nr:hypothetical protein [Pirellulales bacterium]